MIETQCSQMIGMLFDSRPLLHPTVDFTVLCVLCVCLSSIHSLLCVHDCFHVVSQDLAIDAMAFTVFTPQCSRVDTQMYKYHEVKTDATCLFSHEYCGKQHSSLCSKEHLESTRFVGGNYFPKRCF